MDATQTHQSGPQVGASEDLEALISAVRQVLRETAFRNGKLVAPRHLDQIAQDEARSFLSFVETGDEELVRKRGKDIAVAGLGHRPVLNMTEILRGNGHSRFHATEQAVSAYVTALLEGYMLGREEHLLEEQARTHEALLRVRARMAKE